MSLRCGAIVLPHPGVVEVAEDRWPRWAAEQAGTNRGPVPYEPWPVEEWPVEPWPGQEGRD